jgi:hypothetical protein
MTLERVACDAAYTVEYFDRDHEADFHRRWSPNEPVRAANFDSV